jgi:hypothetical protein
MKGIVNKVNMLFNEVNVIDKATLPFRKYVINPEVVPPGQEASIIKPTLKGRGISEKKDIEKAISGKMII